MDFTDLQGNVQEIGRFIAEELTASLVLQNRSFKTIDRANLRNILAEQKLTMTGLINPENARKLKISGVDGLGRPHPRDPDAVRRRNPHHNPDHRGSVTGRLVFKLEDGPNPGTKFTMTGRIQISDGSRTWISTPVFQDLSLGL